MDKGNGSGAPSPTLDHQGSAQPLTPLERELMAALEPFAEGAAHLHPSQPDDGVTLDGIEVRHWRSAAEALSKAQAKENGNA